MYHCDILMFIWISLRYLGFHLSKKAHPLFFVRKIMTENTSIITAAIDIGTEFSRYEFSLASKSHGDPLLIFSPDLRSDLTDRLSMGTPTCVLFNSKENFDSYGYKAEEKYSNLVLDDEHRNWYFFRRFRMMLSNEKVYNR